MTQPIAKPATCAPISVRSPRQAAAPSDEARLAKEPRGSAACNPKACPARVCSGARTSAMRAFPRAPASRMVSQARPEPRSVATKNPKVTPAPILLIRCRTSAWRLRAVNVRHHAPSRIKPACQQLSRPNRPTGHACVPRQRRTATRRNRPALRRPRAGPAGGAGYRQTVTLSS
jgi:hypothetical protein